MVSIRVLAALEKVSSSYSKSEFRKNSCQFLEDLVWNILSTVAPRSLIGLGLSFFCPEIIIGGDDNSTLHLFWQLLDGILERKWIKSSVVKPSKAEFHSFVREQMQLEKHSSRKCPDMGYIWSFCVAPVGLRARHTLFFVSIIRNVVLLRSVSHVQIHCVLDLSIQWSGYAKPKQSLVSLCCESRSRVLSFSREDVHNGLRSVLCQEPSFEAVQWLFLFCNPMLIAAIASSVDICFYSHSDPSESVRAYPSSKTNIDLNRCREDLLVRCRNAKNTSERVLGPESVAFSVTDEASGRSGVRISKVVEVPDV